MEETEASIPSSGLDQQGRGDGYRGDARPEGRSLCEPGCRHRALKEESFPKAGQSMLQLSGSIAMASLNRQVLASDLDRANLPDFYNLGECRSEVRVRFCLLCSSPVGT